MKRLILLITVIAFWGCDNSANDKVDTERKDNKVVTEKFVRNYNDDDYNGIFSMFADVMKEALPIDKTTEFLKGLKSQAGNISNREFVKYENGTYASYKTTFERAVFVLNISIDDNSDINGLFVKPYVEEDNSENAINKISQKLVEHPWVQTASARRVFPQSLHVELKERIPFAKVQLEKIYVMDNFGILLGPEERKFDELPLITGISATNPKPGNNVANEEIIRGLKTMYYINLLPMFKKNPIDSVRISNRSRVTFVTQNRNTEVHMRPGMAQENLKNLN